MLQHLKIDISTSVSTFALLVFILASQSVKADPPEQCAALERKNAVSSKAETLPQFNWNSLKTYKMAFIGEQHGLSRPEDVIKLADLIRGSRNKKTTCLMFEVQSTMSRDEFISVTNTPSNDPVEARDRAHYKELFDKAVAAEFPIWFVAHPYLNTNLTKNQKSEGIAHNIDKVLDPEVTKVLNAGECTHGIMIVGKGHISPDENAESRTLVKHYLEKEGIDSVSFNLQYTEDPEPNKRYKSWSDLCPSLSENLTASKVFSNEAIADLPLFPYVYPKGTLGMFDFTVLHPAQRTRRDTSIIEETQTSRAGR